MAIPIKHNGVYRFHCVMSQNLGSRRVLNAYGTTSLANGSNVMLYTSDPNDKAQQWRAMYAGVDTKNGNRKMYWLNCVLGGRGDPLALDRYMGALQNNADVFLSWKSSAKDQLVYFIERGDEDLVSICLYDGGYALTAASDANGGNNPSSLTAPGNCYWAPYDPSNIAQVWGVETVSAGENPTVVEQATAFRSENYYDEDNNKNYPDNVGECTWYCNGRFYEENKIKNVGTGNAVDWAARPIPEEVSRIDVSNITNVDDIWNTLREKSIAVFSGGSYGHVVFIERLAVGGKQVIFSEANVKKNGSEFELSNGQIEVRNSQLPNASDGYYIAATAKEFISLYGNKLIAIIYKP